MDMKQNTPKILKMSIVECVDVKIAGTVSAREISDMKFFIVSDVHGFYDEMIKALNDAGFDKDNKEHWLISCGDEWDRGPKPVEVMKFFSKLERKTIIRGNHMELFEELCYRCYPQWHDKSNGTTDTVLRLGNYKEDHEFDLCCERALNRTRKYRNDMVPYFETKNYIFVHSWIPLTVLDNLPTHYTRNRKYEFNPDWRNASVAEWREACWGNPFDNAAKGFLPDKTIVFGHWHASAGWAQAEGRSEFGDDAKFDPYYGDGFIAIDACTAHSGKVNVLVIEDGFLEGENED